MGLLRRSAADFAAKPAATADGESISFACLLATAGGLARELSRRGAFAGSRVAILSENSLDAIVAFWGVLSLGAINVDVPVQLSDDVVASILDECRPVVILASSDQAKRLACEAFASELPPLLIIDEVRHSDRSGQPFSEVSVDPNDVAMVIYTSGSTGRPKGIMLTHDNVLSNITAANQLTGFSSSDSILIIVPLYYIHGRFQLLTHALLGGSVVLGPGMQLPESVVNCLKESEVTGFSGVPFHFKALMSRSSFTTAHLPHLRYLLVTGGALQTEDIARLNAMPDVSVHLAYGQTEASPRVTWAGPGEIAGRPGSCGRPLSGVIVEIVDEQGRSMAPGLVGQVVVGGPGIMRGYVSGDERDTGKIDDAGRLWTGDFGYLDEDGYLFLGGRASEMIKSAGQRIHPREIEDVINSYPCVVESIVFGIDDPGLGQRIAALVVAPREKGIEENIRKHCLDRLSYVRTPRELFLVTSLPKTASGKVDRRAALEVLATFLQDATILTRDSKNG